MTQLSEFGFLYNNRRYLRVFRQRKIILFKKIQKVEINFYNKRAKKFFESIDKTLRPRVTKAFDFLEMRGNNLEMPYSKALGGGLFELRTIGANQIRFIYTFHKNQACILHAFVKKTEQITKKDIDYARAQLGLLR